MNKVFFTLFRFALLLSIGVAVVFSFYKADHMANPDKAFLMTLGFWGICLIEVCGLWMLFRMMGIRSRGPLLVGDGVIVLVCWFIYKLMFK